MNVALLGVIAAAMFATLFLVYQTVEAERAQREQVRRTVEVLEELRQVSRSALSGVAALAAAVGRCRSQRVPLPCPSKRHRHGFGMP